MEKNETTMRNTQRRAVTTTEVLSGRTQAVLVRYPEATKQMLVGADASQPAADGKAPETSPPVPQPVQGKAYRCRREPGDNGKLIVTDADGLIPPLDEFEIVAQGMEMVGRANPLAEFLAGRSVAVGQTLAAAERSCRPAVRHRRTVRRSVAIRSHAPGSAHRQTAGRAPCFAPASTPPRTTRRRCGCKSRVRW